MQIRFVTSLLFRKPSDLFSVLQVEINRDQWMKDAIEAERGECPLTATAIIQSVLGHDVEEEDRKHTWEEDANSFISENVSAKI